MNKLMERRWLLALVGLRLYGGQLCAMVQSR